jgi:cysteine-rich repeat protein
MASVALLALAGCECSGEETAQLYAAHDGGPDARAAIDAGRGTGGSPPVHVEAGPGGHAPDAHTDAGDSAPIEAGPDAPAEAGPPPVSIICGDGIRGLDEECDDGNKDDDDFCTTDCRVHDRLALTADNVPVPSFKRREISRGYHVIAGSKKTAALVFADTTASPHELRVALYKPNGTRIGGNSGIVISDEKPSIDETDGVVVALPGNSFAIVWSVLPIGESFRSIAMRTVDGATGELGTTQVVNVSTNGNQEAPDAVWTGSEIVVSWMDRTDPVAPQGRVRRFDAHLNPLGGEEDLSADGAGESTPTLATFGSSYAALWVEDAPDYLFDLHAKGGDVSWTVPGIFRFAGDRFHLAALDARHLVATWTQVDYLADGGYDVASLYAAVFDTESPGAVTPVRIQGLSAALADDLTHGYQEPSLAVAGGRAFVAWVSGPGLGGGFGSAMVMKEIPWDSSAGGLDLSLSEEPLARNPFMQNTSLEGAPAFGVVPWTSGGTLLAAWEDQQRVFGREERAPDVVAEFLPLPIVKLGERDGGADAQ